jgi:electron transport complex protein RnfD
MTEGKLTVSSSPHLRGDEDTGTIMKDVAAALMPALLVAAWMFGVQAIAVTLVSVASCVFFEWGYRKLLKKSNDVKDWSAVVTGILLSYCLPVSVPFWIPVVGGFFAIVVVKQLFGGIGKNFMNPALAGRAFLFSWPVLMTTWVKPQQYRSLAEFFKFYGADAVTGATPMSFLHSGKLPEGITLQQAFIGQIGGSLGEVSAAALLLGGAYLIWRGVISWRIPVTYLGTVAVVTIIAPRGGIANLDWMLWNLTSGGLMLGAIFMATDYVTSPVTPRGQLIFGVGCGLLTVLIRYFGSYPEGVSYSILVMNALVWLIDKTAMPRRFGAKRSSEKEGVK